MVKFERKFNGRRYDLLKSKKSKREARKFGKELKEKYTLFESPITSYRVVPIKLGKKKKYGVYGTNQSIKGRVK